VGLCASHLRRQSSPGPSGGAGNTRNGSTPKTLQTEHGPAEVRTPRDREGSFEPRIVRKRQRRFQGFDEKILALYSRGLSVRDVQAHLREIHGVEVSTGLISQITDALMDDARAWQQRPTRAKPVCPRPRMPRGWRNVPSECERSRLLSGFWVYARHRRAAHAGPSLRDGLVSGGRALPHRQAAPTRAPGGQVEFVPLLTGSNRQVPRRA
jgi:hypothetical protein